MAYSGMNAAAVEKVARDLSTCSGRIDAVLSSVDSVVARTQSAWVGVDASRFASNWHSNRSSLSAVSNSLKSLSRSAYNQASAQRKASNG